MATRIVFACLFILLTVLCPTTFAQERSNLPTPAEEIWVCFTHVTTLDDDHVHIEGFTSEPEEQLILPPLDSSRVRFLTLYYSRDVVGDMSISVAVVPDPAGETLYADLNNDEDLTNDGPPIYFSQQDPEVEFWLTAPDDPAQRTARIIQRVPRSVRANPALQAWFDGMKDEEGNLRPRFAAFANTEGKKGTFYFDDRVALSRGIVELNDDSIHIGIFDFNVNGRYDDERDVLIVDINRDQKLVYTEEQSVFKLNEVFEIDDKRYRLTFVDSYGRGLRMVEVEDEPTRDHLKELQERIASLEVPIRTTGAIDSTFWDLKFETISGDSLHLSEYRGRYLLLNIWGEWCSPCRAEIPFLVSISEGMPPAQFSIIGLLETREVEAAMTFLEEHQAGWPQIRLPDTLRERFNVWQYPTNILILPDGETFLEAGFVNERFFREHVAFDR